MSNLTINAIATQPLVDNQFQIAMINGDRKERIVDFKLTKDELDTILAIDAVDLHQFIRQLE